MKYEAFKILSNCQKAFIYENQCVMKHIIDYKHTVWKWSDVPQSHLIQSGFIHKFNESKFNTQTEKFPEYGLDALALDHNGCYHGIQCKYWKHNSYLCAKDLGTFYQVIYQRLNQKSNNKSKGYLYFSCKLQKDVKFDLMNQNTIVPVFYDLTFK